MRWVRWVVGCFVGYTLVVGGDMAPGAALANPSAITWLAPPECPQAADVREGVERVLGDDRQLTSSDGPRFNGSMKRSEGVWTLELSVANAEGTRTRELSASSCHELTEAGIAVIALALTETTAEPTDVATPPAEPSPPAAHQESSDPRTPVRDQGPEPRAVNGAPPWGAHATMVVDFNVLPDTAAGATLGVSYNVGSWRLSANAIYLPPEHASLTDGRGAEISLAAGSLGGCYWALEGPVTVGPCLKLEAGVLPGEGVSEAGTSGSGRWAAVVPGISAHWQLARTWTLLFAADLVVPLVRDEFKLSADEVYQVPAVGGRFLLGPEVRFP